MLKSMSGYLLILTVFSTIGFLLLSQAVSLSQKPVVLFTDSDAEKLRYSDTEWDKEVIPSPEEDILAPSIIIEEPDVIDTKKGPTIITITPANIFVLFKENGSTLDLDTLDVWGEKFFFKKNITKLVLPHIKTNKEGAVLHMKSVHIPKGKYKVGFKIADVNGRETTRKYRLKVE